MMAIAERKEKQVDTVGDLLLLVMVEVKIQT